VLLKGSREGGAVNVIDQSCPVMVTGASGYLGSWVVRELLDEGLTVNATVRDPTNSERVKHLEGMAASFPGRLKLFKADLLEPGSFDAPMEGCELVLHTASPYFIREPKDAEQEFCRPAREGTRNVLDAANRTPSVKRVVLTSSIAAIMGNAADIHSCPGGVFTETIWNTTSSAEYQAYSYSKTIAEREAWALAGQQDRWDLITILPGAIIGPSLTKRTDSQSITNILEFADGTDKDGVPALTFPWVDVRDVAAAHLKAGFTPEASGRYIVAGEGATILDVANMLRKEYGYAYPFPRREFPKALAWLVAPRVGISRKFVSRNFGYRPRFDNSRSKTELGVSYRPLEQSVKEQFEQMLDDGLLKRQPSAKGKNAAT
jgi:nucleoside-diphosphate-sugar epimerase